MTLPQDVKFHWAAAPHLWMNDDWPALKWKDISARSCIRDIASAGYDGCEFGRIFRIPEEELIDLLAEFSLTLCNRWHEFKLLDGNIEEQEAEFRSLLTWGIRLKMPSIGIADMSRSWFRDINQPIFEKAGLTREELKKLSGRLNHFARMADDSGIQFCYHPHLGTSIQNSDEICTMLEETDYRVHLVFDTGHLYCAGVDPLQFLLDYHERIGHVHFKDVKIECAEQIKSNHGSFYDAICSGMFLPPGHQLESSIPFQDMINSLISNEYAGWIVVEGDRDVREYLPARSAKKSIDYLRSTYNRIDI
jgi:inosose dehydratase